MAFLLEIFFGKPKTPTEVLAEIAKAALDAERIMTREAKRAEREAMKAGVKAQNLLDSDREYETIERQVRARYLIAEQAQDRADRFYAQASVLRDFATSLRVMSSSADMMRAQLRAASVFGRMARMLPNQAQLMQLSKMFELSKLRQEAIRDELGGGIKDGANDLYEEADEEEAGKRESPAARVERRMKALRGDGDVDAALAALPAVLPARPGQPPNPQPLGAPPDGGGEDGDE